MNKCELKRGKQAFVVAVKSFAITGLVRINKHMRRRESEGLGLKAMGTHIHG